MNPINFVVKGAKTCVELRLKTGIIKSSITPSKGIIIFSPGTGEYFNKYGYFLKYFGDQGFDVLSYDRRGHGSSQGGIDTYDECWVEDLLHFIELVKTKYGAT